MITLLARYTLACSLASHASLFPTRRAAAVVARISGVTLATSEYGDRSGFDAYRYGHTYDTGSGGSSDSVRYGPADLSIPTREDLCMVRLGGPTLEEAGAIGCGALLQLSQACPNCSLTCVPALYLSCLQLVMTVAAMSGQNTSQQAATFTRGIGKEWASASVVAACS